MIEVRLRRARAEGSRKSLYRASAGVPDPSRDTVFFTTSHCQSATVQSTVGRPIVCVYVCAVLAYGNPPAR